MRVIDISEPTFAVCVIKFTLVHNHDLDKHIYQQYPANRMTLDRDVIDTVNILRKAGAKKKNIYRYIVENSNSNPTTWDVYNLVRKLKVREEASSTTATRLKKWIVEFCEEPGNVGRIFVDRADGKV